MDRNFNLYVKALGGWAIRLHSEDTDSPVPVFEFGDASTALLFQIMVDQQVMHRENLQGLIWGNKLPHKPESRLLSMFDSIQMSLTEAWGEEVPPLITPHKQWVSLANEQWAKGRNQPYFFVHYDVHHFESAYDKLMAQAMFSISIETWNEALALYTGSFLSGIPASESGWIDFRRSFLVDQYADLLMKAGFSHEDMPVHRAQALEWYKQGFAAQPLRQDIHRGMMRCHHKMGSKTGVVTTYTKIKEVLGDLSGLRPSRETIDLYIRLVGAPPK